MSQLRVDTITDEEGTGSPSFPNGAEFDSGSAGSPSITFDGDTNTGLFRPAADTLAAATNGSERMRIDSSGNVSLTSGNLILSDGAGIDFSAHPNAAGMTSELLDDYEEGVHTVSITTFGGSVTLAADGNQMAYTKVGRIVFVTASLRVESVSSPTGGIVFSLPFLPVASPGGSPFSCAANIRIDRSVSKNYRDFVGGIFGSDMRAYIADVNVILSSGANAQQLQANSLIDIQAHYFV